ncbi:aspartic peptidase domain-containing protein [Hysterangium stoloniferum]|nr:aspartic peptidase domain-containing protein [Hysterangium stoloniferum]
MLPAIFLLLVTYVFAIRPPLVQVRESPITVDIVARVGIRGFKNLVERDRTRAHQLIQAAFKDAGRPIGGGASKREAHSVPITNGAIEYFIPVDIGTPPTKYQLLIDTGSANTWIGAAKSYTVTRTSVDTKQNISVTYGSGSFTGQEFKDTVTLSPQLVAHNQSIAVAQETEGFDGSFDGIFGIGPTVLSTNTFTHNPAKEIPTITDTLAKQGVIGSNVVGVSFQPTTNISTKNGELTFGGVDKSKLTGNIAYQTLTVKEPASRYWGIDQSVRYDYSNDLIKGGSGFFDTGTTLILVSPNAFAAYANATGAVIDSKVGLLTVTNEQFQNMKSLYFHIGGTDFEFTPNAQIWPRSLNTAVGGDPDKIYIIIANLSTAAENGAPPIDFVNGYVFHERFYVAYDKDKNRVGVANTPYTHSTTN